MAKIRNVRVKMRFSALEAEIAYDLSHGRETRGQSHVVSDAPSVDLPVEEYENRKRDALLVLNRGWELSRFDPPEVWMGDIITTSPGVYALSSRVRSNNWATDCGFEIDITPEFTSSVILDADESPITDANDVKANYSWPFFPIGWTMYVRAWADDGDKLVYSIVKSFVLN
jgi:hypothetical protein